MGEKANGEPFWNTVGKIFFSLGQKEKKMIGIYKIQNKQNQKIYIGQSNNIERRLKEHTSPSRYLNSRVPIDWAIHFLGKENFTYEVVEECSPEELSSKESYWIKYYKSNTDGYNRNEGGDLQHRGSNNGRAKLTEEEIVEIRTAYNNHEKQREVYQKYKDKVTWNSFRSIWQGKCWQHIMPEVFTEENRHYYIYENSFGERSSVAKLTNEEVAEYRWRYQFETAQDMYPEISDKISLQTFQKILCNPKMYPEVPSYGKAQKYELTDEEVMESRQFYITHSAKQTYNNFDFAKNIPFSTFKQMLEGQRYYHLPWYSKKYQEWRKI